MLLSLSESHYKSLNIIAEHNNLNIETAVYQAIEDYIKKNTITPQLKTPEPPKVNNYESDSDSITNLDSGD